MTFSRWCLLRSVSQTLYQTKQAAAKSYTICIYVNSVSWPTLIFKKIVLGTNQSLTPSHSCSQISLCLHQLTNDSGDDAYATIKVWITSFITVGFTQSRDDLMWWVAIGGDSRVFVVSLTLKCVFEWPSHSSSVSLLQCWRRLGPLHRHVGRDGQRPASLPRTATGRTVGETRVSKHNKERHL